MPEDKSYIQKAYQFMTNAYGANGAVSPNAFRSNYDAFASRLSSDPKYADKIYGALADAYGSNGSVKREAFTSTIGQFRDKVLLPNPTNNTQAAPALPAVGANQPAPETADNPVDKVLATGTDIPTTLHKGADGTFREKKEPGLMADQKAFEPLIARKEAQDTQNLQQVGDLLTKPKSELGSINMTGQQPAPTEAENSIQDKLKHLDEQDKILHESQAKADEFYKTTAGGLYYSFVRPVYQSMLSTGKNVAAGALRLAGDVGEGFGLDHSKKVLDKTADGLVNYFDFNRLAREGNTSAFLNATPTAQQGKLSTVNLLPKAVEAISSMGTLMGGARVMGGSEGALFTSSFMSTYEDYRQRAKEAGLSNNEADNFAITSAGVTSALEMLSPNKILLGSAEGQLGKQTIFNAIKSGVPVNQAIKQGLKTAFKENAKENVQEFMQNVGDKVIRGGTDIVTGQNRFNEDGAMPSFQENLETAVLTTIATGAMSAKHITHNTTPSAMERSAYTQAAQNIEGFTATVQNAIQDGKIDSHAGRKMIERVGEYKELYDALKDHGKDEDQSSKLAIEAIKSKRITERSKPLAGIKPLQNITSSDEEAQNHIANNVADIQANMPEEGSELSPLEVKALMQYNGGENKIDKVNNNYYKVNNVNLQELYKSNPEFKDYVDNGQLHPSGNKEGLRNPAVINADGTIVDGMNRLAQQYIDGQTQARVLQELKPNNIDQSETEQNAIPKYHKDGIDYLFDQNPKLSKIGTKEQYSAYLKSIFPHSTMQDIVYHGSPNEGIEKLDMSLSGQNTDAESSRKGMYFTDKRNIAEIFGKWKGMLTTKPNVYPALLNISNPYVNLEQDSFKDPSTGKTIKSTEQIRSEHVDNAIAQGNDAAVLGENLGDKDIVVVFDHNKIHLLGTNQDVTNFKNFVTNSANNETIDKSKIKKNAVQEQNPGTLDVRQQAGDGQGVGIQNTQPENTAGESQINTQVASQEEIAKPILDRKLPPIEESKVRRDNAAAGLRDAWNEFQNKERPYEKKGVDLPDPVQDRQFYKALANYIKEELLYRVNQVKGFAGQSKSAIKRAITKSIKAEGVGIHDVSMLNDAFEQAYAEAKQIPGVLSENNDRISYKQYIKDRIQVREAGRRKGFSEGAQMAKQRVAAVRGAILETLKSTGINLSMLQKRRILSILQNATTSKDINKTIDRAINATTQMIWEQKNKIKIDQTKKLIKSVNKLKRAKSMVLQDVEWIKQLTLPTPSKVDDLDTYKEMLNDFLQSRKGNEHNTKFTKEEIAEFVDQENARIYKEKRQSMQEDLDALKEKGQIPEDVTLDEYTALLDNKVPDKLKEGISPKDEILRQELKTRLGYLNDRVAEFDGEEKNVIERLTQVDPKLLNSNDLVRLNNVLNNIAEYGTLDAAGDIITTHEAKKAAEELAAGGDKIRELPSEKVLKKKNLSNIMSALFYNDNALTNFRTKTIGAIERQLAPVHSKVQQVVKEFVDLNRKHKIDGLGNAKLHAYAYLNQYKGVENGEISDNLKRKLDELLDDAKYFMDESNRLTKRKGASDLQNATDRLDALKSLGLIDYNITENKEGKKITRELKVDIKDNFKSEDPTASLKAAENNLTEGEKAVYDFVRDRYDALTDKLEFVTRTYAGKEFKREQNYVSQVAKKKNGSSFDNNEMSGETDITSDLRSINRKPSGTTLTRADKKGADVYYDGDFFSNFVNRYYQSVYTAEILPALQTVAKTVNSQDFEKYITGQLDNGFAGKGAKNYNAFKAKLIQAVNEGKYSPFFQAKSDDVFHNVASKIMSSGIRLALNNIWQGPAQLAPSLIHNFSIANPKAVAYAIGSAFKSLSPTNRQYANDRALFLNNFTGVKRSALGSEAYDNYVKRIGNNPAWWVNTENFISHLRKASAFSLEKGDRAAQNTAYISGYITSLMQQGKLNNPADFDFAEAAANPDAKALAFAEQTASAINNESSREYKPDVLKDSQNAKYLWMLQGFSLNAYQNAMNKAKIIWDSRSTNEERKEAALHFTGYLGELATYQLVKKAARGFQFAISGALLTALFHLFPSLLGVKIDETEEEKKERQAKDNIRLGANALADLSLSGTNAAVQVVFKMAANDLYKSWAKAESKKIREEQGSFNPNGTHLSPYFVPFYGAGGSIGGGEFYYALSQKAVELMSHQMHWDSDPNAEDNKSQEQKDLERLGKNLSMVSTAAAMLAGSSDLMILNNKMQMRLKGAVKESKSEGGGGGNGRSNRSGTTKSTRRSSR